MKSRSHRISLRSELTEFDTTKKSKGKLIIFKNFIVDVGLCEIFLEKFLDSPIQLHFNQTQERKDFFSKFCGSTLRELGFDLTLVTEYQYKEGDVYVGSNCYKLDEYRKAVREITIS